MKITYEDEVDYLYIRLLEGAHDSRVRQLHDERSLNIGAGEVLVGIEVLDASEVLGSGQVPEIVLENLKAS